MSSWNIIQVLHVFVRESVLTLYEQRLNLAKLGTPALWRYWRHFNLVCTSPPIKGFLLFAATLLPNIEHSSQLMDTQVNVNPNPTKEQLIHGVQNHLLSQVTTSHTPLYVCLFFFRYIASHSTSPPFGRTATGRDAGYRGIHPHGQEIENPLLVGRVFFNFAERRYSISTSVSLGPGAPTTPAAVDVIVEHHRSVSASATGGAIGASAPSSIIAHDP
ncbi:hypothetical protein BHE74_00019304 [Ensete ventricosum]|nr:hypothetical protein BHE74_00019304 [Ensete ventricosum]